MEFESTPNTSAKTSFNLSSLTSMDLLARNNLNLNPVRRTKEVRFRPELPDALFRGTRHCSKMTSIIEISHLGVPGSAGVTSQNAIGASLRCRFHTVLEKDSFCSAPQSSTLQEKAIYRSFPTFLLPHPPTHQ